MKRIKLMEYEFKPAEEARKTQEVTIRKLEKMCGKSIKMHVALFSHRLPLNYEGQMDWEYKGQVERTGAGYYFRGNDGVVDYQCKILDLLRNPKFDWILIRGTKAKPSSGSH